MAYDKETLAQAKRLIDRRHADARSALDSRTEEIRAKAPEIIALKRELAQTSIKLSKIILGGGDNVPAMLDDLKQRNLYIQSRIREMLQEVGYPPDYLTLKPSCDLCQDTGFVGNQKCECLLRAARSIGTEKLNRMSPLSLCGFEGFRLEYYPDKPDGTGQNPREVMRKILSYCQQYAADFNENSGSIFMLGDTGLGKTHLSLAIASKVIDKGYNVLYGCGQDFLHSIENEHFGRVQDSDTLGAILQADLLILDDLGAEYGTEFYVSTIYNIVNTRLNTGRPTIISSNLTVKEIEKKYNRRIVSRLFSSYTCLRFVGNDVRLQKKSHQCKV